LGRKKKDLNPYSNDMDIGIAILKINKGFPPLPIDITMVFKQIDSINLIRQTIVKTLL